MGAALMDEGVVPGDFPRAPGETPAERLGAWYVCEEFAGWLREMCEGAAQLLDTLQALARNAGWGTDDELQWAANRAAALMSEPGRGDCQQ